LGFHPIALFINGLCGIKDTSKKARHISFELINVRELFRIAQCVDEDVCEDRVDFLLDFDLVLLVEKGTGLVSSVHVKGESL
jgi:hypothetical protein